MTLLLLDSLLMLSFLFESMSSSLNPSVQSLDNTEESRNEPGGVIGGEGRPRSLSNAYEHEIGVGGNGPVGAGLR